MVREQFRFNRLHLAALAVLAMLACTFPQISFAMDGISGCGVANVEVDSKQVWHYTINLRVPEGKTCSVDVADDSDPKGWTHCWDKGSDANPITETCDDPVDNPNFNNLKARATCGEDQHFYAYCYRDRGQQ
jgi:hypothetical protein